MADTLTLAEKRQSRELATQDAASAIENVLIKGDLKALSPEQRNAYYLRLCEMTGLNPLTQPFEYLTLNGKLVLYAKKACTDQLRAIHSISVVDMDDEERRGVCIVTVKVQDAKGRTDMGKGAVNVENLKGDALANAIMKAETKAKRRATLSICGLGLLDETEIDSIPGAVAGAGALPPSPANGAPAISSQRRRVNIVTNPDTGKKIDTECANQQRKDGAWDRFTDTVQGYTDMRNLDGLKQWFTSPEVAAYVAGWVFKDQAHEHFDAACDLIEQQQ